MNERRRSPSYSETIFYLAMAVLLALSLTLAIRWLVINLPDPYRDPDPPITTIR